MIPKSGSKAKLQIAVDLRPVSSATITESWPMPHLDSEIQDFAGSKKLVSIDFFQHISSSHCIKIIQSV